MTKFYYKIVKMLNISNFVAIIGMDFMQYAKVTNNTKGFQITHSPTHEDHDQLRWTRLVNLRLKKRHYKKLQQ